MGQQQLILLVIGIVLVGLAVLVGLEAYGRARREAEFDAMTQVALRLVDDLNEWYATPAVFGGGGSAVCPFTPPAETHGRQTVSGIPFAGAPPQYPAPASGTWIVAGNGLFAQLDEPNDIVRVVSSTYGDLSLEVQVHGPGPACLSTRRRTYRSSAWALDSPHTPASACPRVW